ncbi:MAG: ferredoxin:glutaredoxin reductase [Myxococcales bacterium]|nr:ferredoxin:glutaredoxin reductase [Myxococcales bacterium]
MSREEAEKLRLKLQREAEAGGYLLNPDRELVLDLMEGLLVNQARYGYMACPCRLADGTREQDRDIICPCDYRDDDLAEHGGCYCGLYVSQAVAEGKRKLKPVPERRGEKRPEPSGTAQGEEHRDELVGFTRSGIPVWRCVVCGYLCARPKPPLKCPICKADQDRFERFA